MGTATSSYQIEGAPFADGKSESIWDRFAHTPGKTKDGDTGDIACDHYHRYPEDVALMADLGVRAYRFSIAWPRVLPNGRGPINQPGLAFYDRLVDSLLAANITPFVTLYHWDMPQVLEDAGGWPARATAEAFVHYADVVSRRLGDRVTHWITFNEPWVSSMMGYDSGIHAPGVQDTAQAVRAAHHLLLAHGWSVPVLRQNSPNADVGITLNLMHVQAASPSAADQKLARRLDGTFNRWFLDPVFGRGYPADATAVYAPISRADSISSNRAIWTPLPRPLILWASIITPAKSCAIMSWPTICRTSSSPRRLRSIPTWAGKCIPTACISS